MDFYIDYKWVILCNSCLLFARITMDIQIKILTMDYLGCIFFIFISNIIFIASVAIPLVTIRYYTLLVLFILQCIELSAFIYIRAKEITNYHIIFLIRFILVRY